MAAEVRLAARMDRDPSHIMQVGMGFWPSKTLLSAVELELFTQLGARVDDRRGAARAARPRTSAASTTSSTRWSRSVPRARGRRPRWPLPQHRGRRGLPRQEQPGLHRRDPRDGERPPVPLLGRPHRGAADRQAPERGQAHRQVDVRGALRRPGAARAVHGRDGRASRSATSRRWPRSSTSPGTRRSATSAAPPASSRTILAQRHPHLRCTSFDLPVVEPIAEQAIAARRPRPTA